MQVKIAQSKRIALLISILYCFFGILWIGLSDSLLLNEQKNDGSQFISTEMLGDILFVVCSAILIFFLIYLANKKNILELKNQFEKQQEVLEKSEKLYRAMIENTEDIISLIDKDGNVMYVNSALERLTGFTLEEVKGRPAFMVMHPENIAESKAVVEQLLSNPDVVYDRTNRFLNKKTGDYIWVQGTVINLLGDEKVGAIISNYRDITAKRITEQRTNFNHNNLKALINNTNDLMWSVDTNFKLITYNKAFYDAILFLSGKAIESGSNVLETEFDADKLSRFKTYYKRAFIGETFTVVEHDKHPQKSWSEISFYPIFNENVIVGTACFVKNITERCLSEIRLNQFTQDLIDIKNKLELNEFKLKQAQAIAHVGSWEVDFISGVAFWSDETCRIYGISPQENLQSHDFWKSFIHPDDLQDVLKHIEEPDTLHPPSFYHRIKLRDGSIRHIYLQTQFNFNAVGETIGLYGVTQDVTEQKLAEKEIIEKTDQLRDLSNHLQNIREEERAFIAREIHDELGQQLTALRLDIDWIMRKQNNPDPPVILRLQEMLEFANNLITKVRKISADLRPPIIDDLGLIAALEWICEDFERKTEIICRFTSSIKERKFEENFSITTYRILQESLTNIIRHAQAKLVTVSVTENEEAWFLEIADNGKGICSEKIKNGRTLGVLGMKERASLLGGDLIISGAENKGTTVKLILPLKTSIVKNGLIN